MSTCARFPSPLAASLAAIVLSVATACGGSSADPTPTPTPPVPDGAPVSIAITPALPVSAVGQTLQFRATATYANAATADVTSQVTWLSANPSIASIAASGLATMAPSVSFNATQTTIEASLPTTGATLTARTWLNVCQAAMPAPIQSRCGALSVSPAEGAPPGATITLTIVQSSDLLCRGTLRLGVGVPGVMISAPGGSFSGQGATFPSLDPGAPSVTRVATFQLSANPNDWAYTSKCPTGQDAPNGSGIFMTSGPWASAGTDLYSDHVPFTVGY